MIRAVTERHVGDRHPLARAHRLVRAQSVEVADGHLSKLGAALLVLGGHRPAQRVHRAPCPGHGHHEGGAQGGRDVERDLIVGCERAGGVVSQTGAPGDWEN